MPFRSKSQRRFFYAAEARGDLPEGTAAEWEQDTPKGKDALPEKAPERGLKKWAKSRAR